MIHLIRTLSVIFTLSIFSLSLYAHGVKVVVIPMGGDAEPLQNIITVAKKNGNFEDPVAAMASIEGLADENNRYLMVIGPGVYVLTEALVMQEYVDISGSGQNATKLTGAISSDAVSQAAALVQGADHAEIRSLTIENTGTGGNTFSVGVYNSFASPTMADLTVIASGYGSLGVYNLHYASPKMSDMTVVASGENGGYGIDNSDYSSPTMSNMVITASGESNVFGIYNRNYSSPVMSGLTITASGGINVYGVLNSHFSSPMMFNMIVTASAGNSGLGGLGSNGIYNMQSSSPTMSGMFVTASGISDNFGVFNWPLSSARIHNFTISATGGATNTSVAANTGSGVNETYISNSILTGPVDGTPLCSFTFSSDGVDLTADCTP